MPNHSFARTLAVLPLLAGPALAQDEVATFTVADHGEHGAHLADGEGMSVYLFEADRQGQGDTMAVMTCEGECLEAWPPVMTQGEPQAGEGVNAELLGTITHDDGTMHVTYNGWPLYYYHEDTEPGDTNGHDIEEFGAEWYLMTAEGEKAGEEHEAEGHEETSENTDLQGQMESVQQPMEAAMAAGDWETLGSMFAEDAVYLPFFTGDTVEGREAIQSLFEQNPAEAIDIRSSQVEMIGETMLFDIGTFTLTLPEEAGGGTFEGEYVSLTEMGENGPQVHKLITFPLRQPPETPAQE